MVCKYNNWRHLLHQKLCISVQLEETSISITYVGEIKGKKTFHLDMVISSHPLWSSSQKLQKDFTIPIKRMLHGIAYVHFMTQYSPFNNNESQRRKRRRLRTNKHSFYFKLDSSFRALSLQTSEMIYHQNPFFFVAEGYRF